jgi:uncharacterized protein (DUF1330 family)
MENDMHSHIDPDPDAFASFKTLPRDQPIMMLNLVRFRDRARYEDGREASGREAYVTYSKESAPVFLRVGGEIVWRGNPQLTLIGPQDEQWDAIFVARYPSASAFLEMVTDPVYREAVKHRQAAVLDSRLIRTSAIGKGGEFAEG